MYGYILSFPNPLFLIEILDLSECWLSLWGLMDTKLKKNTKFNPQINGQTELVNRTVVHLLHDYCNKHPKLWDEHLHYIQHAYN